MKRPDPKVLKSLSYSLVIHLLFLETFILTVPVMPEPFKPKIFFLGAILENLNTNNENAKIILQDTSNNSQKVNLIKTSDKYTRSKIFPDKPGSSIAGLNPKSTPKTTFLEETKKAPLTETPMDAFQTENKEIYQPLELYKNDSF